MAENAEGNYFNKYESRNPLIQLMVRRFKSGFVDLLKPLGAKSVLDAGCGEGYMTKVIRDFDREIRVTAFDISRKALLKAEGMCPGCSFRTGDIYKIEEPGNRFDLVVSLEVLEHLTNPQRAIRELKRVSKKYIIVSVPHEPWWSLANMLRGRYIMRFGNTPGHMQKWSKSGIVNELKKQLKVRSVRTPGLWIMVLCEK